MNVIQSLSAIKITLRGKALQNPILSLFDCKNEAFAIFAWNLFLKNLLSTDQPFKLLSQ